MDARPGFPEHPGHPDHTDSQRAYPGAIIATTLRLVHAGRALRFPMLDSLVVGDGSRIVAIARTSAQSSVLT